MGAYLSGHVGKGREDQAVIAYFGDGVMAIDCGANVGVHTLEWSRLMYGWGEVIAFEAQENELLSPFSATI